jgi:putative ABC transport system substrate-binding protein
MRRRELIGVTSIKVIWPFAARAQPHERVQRIGVLMHLEANDREGQDRLSAFLEALKQLGWTHLRAWRAPMR